jgi:hypothetical protein
VWPAVSRSQIPGALGVTAGESGAYSGQAEKPIPDSRKGNARASVAVPGCGVHARCGRRGELSRRHWQCRPRTPLGRQSSSKSRWSVLSGGRGPWTSRTSPWPRLTHGGAFGLWIARSVPPSMAETKNLGLHIRFLPPDLPPNIVVLAGTLLDGPRQETAESAD